MLGGDCSPGRDRNLRAAIGGDADEPREGMSCTTSYVEGEDFGVWDAPVGFSEHDLTADLGNIGAKLGGDAGEAVREGGSFPLYRAGEAVETERERSRVADESLDRDNRVLDNVGDEDRITEAGAAPAEGADPCRHAADDRGIAGEDGRAGNATKSCSSDSTAAKDVASAAACCCDTEVRR
mmetsp:Transcript_111037/g.279205  ORF Transcript_111037/g.279205 Transcript_111037/m.279205 type:complete len:181 (-) Transcript_111037:441-983(-)